MKKWMNHICLFISDYIYYIGLILNKKNRKMVEVQISNLYINRQVCVCVYHTQVFMSSVDIRYVKVSKEIKKNF